MVKQNLIVEGFINRTYPKEHWNHEAHLHAALWFSYQYPFYEALFLLKNHIISYNLWGQTTITTVEGYHETLTHFWTSVTWHFIQGKPENTPYDEIVQSFLSSKWAAKDLPLNYFSAELLYSTKARATWVQPDLMPLDLAF